ncbi:MAG: hypothetical protein ABW133_06485 [Polyangiaceae bacterium]
MRFKLSRFAVALTTCGAALFGASHAHANGRYPLAGQLVIDPANPDHMVARATFGLLDSDDGGRTFRWVCESAIGYFGVEDPPIAVTASGAAIVASSKGISVSPDRGCTWLKNPSLTGKWYGVDVTVQPSRPHEALAVLSNIVDGAYTVSVARSTNDGTTWDEMLSTFGTTFIATTIEVAPSNPDRVYVSGKVLPDGTAVMMRSDDGGHTWTSHPLDIEGAFFSIYIGAVDPHDPDMVYLRTNADDIGRVLVSRDGAATWTEVWQVQDDVAGFALSADGSTLAVGSSAHGVSVASTSDFAFRRTSNAEVYCLTFWGEKLLVCTKEAINGFSIGVSSDLGEHFEPLLHLRDVLPRSCGAGTPSSTQVCAAEWEMFAPTIGADAGARAPIDAGSDTAAPPAQSCSCNFTRRAPGELLAPLFFMAFSAFAARRAPHHRRSARKRQ